ncbi:MAG: hypothetical protein HYX82_03520 [Chloroflexi bacterium]|nr:hypothetical protein [Chloroflexota bacterium]
MDVRTFVTVQALIVAALLAWAQLWSRAYDIYRAANDPIWHISLSLAGIYSAVFASLISIAIAVAALELNMYAVGLASFSWIIATLIVFLSAIPLVVKSFKGATQWHPLFVKRLSSSHSTLVAVVAGMVILVACLSWVGPALVQIWNDP